MPNKSETRRIAEWLDVATHGCASLRRDLTAFEALHDGPMAGNPRRGHVAVTLRALDAACRAKRSGRLAPEQVDRLGGALVDIARCSGTLLRLGFRVKPSILEEIDASNHGDNTSG
jgi:hypothetical protein